MRLYLIRHPRPEGSSGICYGRLDVPVTPTEVQRAIVSIRSNLSDAVLHSSSLYSSPAQRCLVLAQQFAITGAPIVLDDLAEIDFGRWEGGSWDAVPRHELDAWSASLMDYRVGGGESVNMAFTRWKRFCDTLRSTTHENVIAMTHAGIIRLAYMDKKQIAPENIWQLSIEFGSVHAFDL